MGFKSHGNHEAELEFSGGGGEQGACVDFKSKITSNIVLHLSHIQLCLADRSVIGEVDVLLYKATSKYQLVLNNKYITKVFIFRR